MEIWVFNLAIFTYPTSCRGSQILPINHNAKAACIYPIRRERADLRIRSTSVAILVYLCGFFMDGFWISLLNSIMRISVLLISFFLFGVHFVGQAQTDSLKEQRWNVHFQATTIPQYKAAFSAPYSGTLSLVPEAELKTSFTATVFGGVKLWKGGELYTDIEMGEGSGLSGASGIAGFPNGEIYRIGTPTIKPYLARAYLSQIFNFDDRLDASEEDGANQLAGRHSKRFLQLTLGKLSMADAFDANKYSHDPRSQFFNWSLNTSITFGIG